MAIHQIFLPLLTNSVELVGVITDSSFLGSWQRDDGIVLYWRGNPEKIVEHISQALAIVDISLPASSITVSHVEEKDWNETWANSVQPIRVGTRVCISPNRSAPLKSSPEDIHLIIDPKQAFGTGHHDTTQLLIECLEDVNWDRGLRVMDVGTGSGILSMVALRLGAYKAFGFDIDQTAIDCAREYARENTFNDELELLCSTIQDCFPSSYDIILANLDRKTLLEVQREFLRFSHEGTLLFLSGLLWEDEEEMIVTFGRHGWRHCSSRIQNEWVALQFSFSPGSKFSSSG